MTVFGYPVLPVQQGRVMGQVIQLKNPDGTDYTGLTGDETWLCQVRRVPDGRLEATPIVDDTDFATGVLVLRLSAEAAMALGDDQVIEVTELAGLFPDITLALDVKPAYAHA